LVVVEEKSHDAHHATNGFTAMNADLLPSFAPLFPIKIPELGDPIKHETAEGW